MPDFNQMKEVFVSQDSVAVSFRCGGQIHSHLFHIYVWFYVPKNI